MNVLLSLDVSSTAAGWAIFRGESLHLCGVIRPMSGLDSVPRIAWIRGGVVGLLETYPVDRVCMEWSSGKVHGRLKGRGVSGLAILGQAQGTVRELARGRGLDPALVAENDWTKGAPKAERAGRIALEFPAYREFRDAGKDRGLDAADAIGIGLYHLARTKLEALIGEAR